VRQYLDLLGRILSEGEDVQSGAVIKSEDRKATCRMLLAQQLRLDLREGFPILTTKPVPFDIVVDEVLWFLRGETNIKTLGRTVLDVPPGTTGVISPAGIEPKRKFLQRHIWDSWANNNGDVRYIYGRSWRYWDYPEHLRDGDHDDPDTARMSVIGTWDQVDDVLKRLKAVAADPADRSRRRIILTGWDPPMVPKMGLAPCHTLSQWLPTNGYLDVVCHWRSIDMFLGAPFNVIQYALLAHIFGRLAGLKPRHLVANIADCHLYDNQFEQVRAQLKRDPGLLPSLKVDDRFFATCPDLSIEQMKQADPSWFSLDGYVSHMGKLRAEVAV
jgi:thymidylate synthase